ncbi:YdbT family protein [Humibacter ginsengisoli]
MLSEQMMTTETHVLRPHRHLLASGMIAALALTTPLFAVAYWLTISSGGWQITLAVHVFVALIAILAVLQYRRTKVLVSPEGVLERGFLGRVSEMSKQEIGMLCLIEIYSDNALDTQPNLFILDKDGAPRIRLRGQYWSRADMEDLADVLDRPLVSPQESVTLSEMRSTQPGWLYWFERIPLLTWL